MRKDFPSVYRSMGGAEDKSRALGGLGDTPSVEWLLAKEAHDALDRVSAAIAGVTNPEARLALWEEVSILAATLFDANTVRPDF